MSLNLLSLVFSLIAIGFSLYTWRKSFVENLDDVCEVALNELVKISIEFPQFRDEEACKSALSSDDINEKLRYEGFAVLVWNYLEMIFEKYGKSLEKQRFYGSMMDLGQRHRHFLFHEDNYKYYDTGLIEFLKIAREEVAK